MQDLVNTFMLICAAVASLAFGVLIAYGFFRALFQVLHLHARSVAAPQPKAQVARVS